MRTPRALAAITLGLAVLAAASCTAQEQGTFGSPSRPVRLTVASSCDVALDQLRDLAAARVGPYGFADGRRYATSDGDSAARDDLGSGAPKAETPTAPQTQEHSGTNTHERAVDEPDMVKTDGRRIVTLTGTTLRVIDAKSRRVTGTLDFGQTTYAQDLFLDGDRALVIVPSGGYAVDLPSREGPADMPAPVERRTRLLLVDLTGGPKVVSEFSIDADYVDARSTDGTARVVVRSGPALDFVYPDGARSTETAIKENRAIVRASATEDWLPAYTVKRGGAELSGRVGCEAVRTTSTASGQTLLTVLSFDLGRDLGDGAPMTVTADGSAVYGSGKSLYVSHTAYPVRIAESEKFAPDDVEVNTRLFKFDVSKPGRPSLAASGEVPGSLLNQYSMSEHDGHLRVATTSGPGFTRCCDQPPATESAVYVLREDGESLAVVGSVGGLGKGERIYAVRFTGPVGYVVTFRQVDPLYTLDLRNPRAPKVVGELKITGYSAYLHPVDEDTLLGVGQEATEEGRRRGLQVSVFDVSDPADPTRSAQFHLPDGYSEAEFDPHAFLYWPKTGLVAVPIVKTPAVTDGQDKTVPERHMPETGLLVLRLRDGQLSEVGTVRHPSDDGTGIRRSLVIGDTLWTFSQTGAKASDLSTLAERAWVAY